MGSSTPDLDTAIAILSRRGWFAERPAALRAALRRIGRLRRLSPGEALYLVGDEPNGIFGLVEGGVDIAIPRADGLEMTVHRADTGFWIGDLAMFSGQTRLVSIIAALPTVVVHFPQRPLRLLVEAAPELHGDFYALTYENMRLVLRLVANLASTPSEVRVAMRLLMHDETSERSGINISQGKLAELVGLSAPTLQRALRRLQNDNLIRVGYSRIDILDRRGLRSICGDVGHA
jgi:CRP/FNR family transcriptional regulator, cyclic AMP receptor protein